MILYKLYHFLCSAETGNITVLVDVCIASLKYSISMGLCILQLSIAMFYIWTSTRYFITTAFTMVSSVTCDILTYSILVQLILSLTFSLHHPIWMMSAMEAFNTFGQNGHQFTDEIFKCILLMKIYGFRLRCQWILSLRAQLTIFQHWFI